MAEKSKAELLREELAYAPTHAMKHIDEKEVQAADDFCVGYMQFLNESRTEREAVAYMQKAAEDNGFVPFDRAKKYTCGDKVYFINRSKAIILTVFGKKSVREGVRIAAAHIDSPRLDLKPNPLYEDEQMALFKTHYYGGIKKYQWTAIPLSLHGVVYLKDGTCVNVCVGEKEGEPKFVVTDLLPHLAREQEKRTLEDGIKGEELNVLVGSRPFCTDEGSELVKLNILKLLFDKYGMTEKDFLSAELEVVPAMPVCDIGFDRSMIGGYGHDDRVCAYPSAMAAFDVEDPEYTCVTVLTDKEETGSDGNTGLNSSYMPYFLYDLAEAAGCAGYEVLRNSKCLSADVNAAFDPTFPSVQEKRNAAFINRGVVITKYTGARGKSGTSDANADYMSFVRRVLDDAKVVWQTGELGAVDAGGGGTVAKFISKMNIDTIDLGVPVMSMHAPFEMISKADLYEAHKAFSAFCAY
jgi:aspartyl aminopeptidase